MDKRFFQICHGCAEQIHGEPYWQARVGDKDKMVYFHPDCYAHYKAFHRLKLRWAQEVRHV